MMIGVGSATATDDIDPSARASTKSMKYFIGYHLPPFFSPLSFLDIS